MKFELKLDKPMKMTLKYDLAVSGDDISGKVELGLPGSGNVPGTASAEPFMAILTHGWLHLDTCGRCG